MPSSLIVAAMGLEAGGFAAAAVTFGVRVVTTLAISSIIAKQMTPDTPTDVGSQGGRVQLSPATDNKLPVLYGESYISGAVTDAKISTDQQTMWYVISLGEKTDTGSITIEDVYWDDKLLLFSSSIPSEIEGWWNQNDNTRVYGVAGKISMWFYQNGSSTECDHRLRTLGGTGSSYGRSNVSAISVLQDEAIDSSFRWTSKDKMSNTIFAVVRVKYDQDHGITGLGQLRFKVKNQLGTTTGDSNGSGPGSVIKDYLTNSRYGCGVALANIDTDSLAALDDYAYEQFSLTTPDNQSFTTSYRYRIDGPLNTSNDCLSNLNQLASCCDSWIQWNELTGKWGVVINKQVSTATMTVVTADTVIGGINVTPIDLKSMGNSCRVTFPNKDYIDQTDFRYIPLPAEFWADNEPVNELNLTLPFVNNHIQATWLGYKQLWESRNDIVINFSMDYSGIRIDAGDVIAVKHEWYGWLPGTYGGDYYQGKPFRVTQVKEYKSADGFLSVQISAVQYNDNIYEKTDYNSITQIGFSGVSDPEEISEPTAPWIPTDYVDEENSTFIIRGEIPDTGNTIGMEFWYSIKGPDWENNNFTLYSTQYYAEPSRGAVYPKYFDDGVTPYYEEVIAVNLPPGEYWFKTRAIGANATSNFSETSDYNG